MTVKILSAILATLSVGVAIALAAPDAPTPQVAPVRQLQSQRASPAMPPPADAIPPRPARSVTVEPSRLDAAVEPEVSFAASPLWYDQYDDPSDPALTGYHGNGLEHPRCKMPQHHPYYARPQSYYYFRPYNYFHIPLQQAEAASWGGDPRLPYDNSIFKNIYNELQIEFESVDGLPGTARGARTAY